MTTRDKILVALKDKWYTQEFNATPLLISNCGGSMMDLGRILGDKFPYWWGWFKEDYCGVSYHHDSLHRLGGILFEKTKEDPEFLVNIRKQWEDEYAQRCEWLGDVDWTRLDRLTDQEIIGYLQKSLRMIWYAVGAAHIVEPFALSTEKRIRMMLAEHVEGSELNSAFTLLTTPTEQSFLTRSDDALHRISLLEDDESRSAAIKIYLRDFFYIRNSYVARVQLTEQMIEDQLAALQYKPQDPELVQKKLDMIERLKLPDEVVRMLNSLEFVTILQDDRKEQILISIDYIERLLEELSIRLDIPVRSLRYLVPMEVDETLLDDENLAQKLAARIKGVIIHATIEEEDSCTECFDEIMERLKGAHEDCKTMDLHGMTASMGLAVGKVKICRSMEEINSFVQGDVLVASMTRPEYLPAMKKACAIVTDEGGITCHAAIVSRELGIPCVIGTKNATKVLTDGMIVEVKANHGLVRVLECE